MKNFQEPEEKDMDNQNANAEIIDDFNPLDEPVIEKDYTKHNVKINPNDFKTDIPEPKFTPPPMTGMMTDEEKSKKPDEPFNPKMNDLSSKDKNEAANRFAKMIMGFYKMLNEYADNRLLFDEKKIFKMQVSGEIDLSIAMPFNANTVITSGELIEEYNGQTRGSITVTKQFEDETMPVLTRVLAKRGAGLTDEHYLAFLFGKDALNKMFIMTQSLSVKKDILNQLKEMTAAYKGGGGMPQPMAQPAAAPQQTYTYESEPSPEPEPQYEPEEEVYEEQTRRYNPDENVNDFVGIMTGSITQEDLIEDEPYQEPKKSTKTTKSGAKRGRKKKS